MCHACAALLVFGGSKARTQWLERGATAISNSPKLSRLAVLGRIMDIGLNSDYAEAGESPYIQRHRHLHIRGDPGCAELAVYLIRFEMEIARRPDGG